MLPTSTRSAGGFTLIETIVATGILVTALAGIAQLLALCVRSTREAGAHGVAMRAAQSKLEAVRASTFSYDDDGAPLTHAGLEPSPSRSLFDDLDGYADLLDNGGAVVDGEDEAAFTRRWAVTPLDDRVPEAVVVEVCVFSYPAEGRGPLAADACVSTIRSRQP